LSLSGRLRVIVRIPPSSVIKTAWLLTSTT
jgi:hypothetical protein